MKSVIGKSIDWRKLIIPNPVGDTVWYHEEYDQVFISGSWQDTYILRIYGFVCLGEFE